MDKKIILASAAGAAILVSAIAVTSVYASSFGPGRGRNYSPERHEQMTKAFANNDYNAWRSAVGDRPVANKVNQQNFSNFSKMHDLMQQGKYEEAAKMRQELGLGGQGRGYRGTNNGQGSNRNGNFVDANKDGICDHMQK